MYLSNGGCVSLQEIVCKHCGSDAYAKSGFVLGKQRYKCKMCDKSYRTGDKREKYRNTKDVKVAHSIDNRYLKVIAGWKDCRVLEEYHYRAHDIASYVEARSKKRGVWPRISQKLIRYNILKHEYQRRITSKEETLSE